MEEVVGYGALSAGSGDLRYCWTCCLSGWSPLCRPPTGQAVTLPSRRHSELSRGQRVRRKFLVCVTPSGVHRWKPHDLLVRVG